MGDGTEPHVALQGRCDPASDAPLACHLYPFAASVDASVERGLQHDVLRVYGVEQCLLHRSHVHADELLVEGDGQGRLTAQGCHLGPLVLAYGLLYGVDVVLCQGFQSAHGIFGREATVGIHAQLYLLLAVHLAYALDEVELLEEVDGANLQFHAVESALQLLLQSGEHLVVGAHPYQSVDGDALLAPCEGRVVEACQVRRPCRHIDSGALTEEVGKGGLQSEGDAGVGTYHVVGYAPHLFHHLAHLSERELVFGLGVTAQVGQGGTFAHALDARMFCRGEGEVITVPGGVDTP